MKAEHKLRFLVWLYLFLLLVIFGRTFYWQVVNGDRLAVAADKQHFSLFDVPAVRGEIRTRDGFPLVSNKESYLLYANLPDIKAPKKEIAEKITPLLVESNPQLASDSAELSRLEESVATKLDLPDTVWVKLAPGINPEIKAKIEDLNFSGLSFAFQTVRDYPEASMAAHLLGFVGETSDGMISGKFGLESYFDKELSGRMGRFLEERDPAMRPILIGLSENLQGLPGNDLEITLDRSIQLSVEKNLEEGIRTWGAAGGTAIVMEAMTGDILATASFPNYEPRNYFLYSNDFFKDPMISDLYEPGSIMKPLIMAAAINEGIVTPQTRCPACAGPVTIGEYTIHTFNNQYHPDLTMTDVLVNSDNTGMVYVGKTLGFEKLYDYLKSYGFSDRTGIDLGSEETSKLRPVGEWYPIDQATAAFGQGIAVTPIQMVRAFGALANQGNMVVPRVVRAVASRGQRREIPLKPSVRVFDESTAKTVAEILVRVARESPLKFPLGRTKGLSDFKIAAKSGTAQIPIAGHYEKDRTIASVIGFVPAFAPRFVVLVKLDSPTVRPWGSDTAGPIFFNIVADILHYYGINPE